MGKLSLGLGIGIGYVLGTRAGRARYEQIQQAASKLTGRPEVQDAVGKVRDSLPTPLQGAVDNLVKTSSGGSGSGSASSTTSSAPPGGEFPLEDEEVVSQTFSAFTERTAGAAPTEEPGVTGGPAVVNPGSEDDEPVAQTFSAFTERTADEPQTEHTR